MAVKNQTDNLGVCWACVGRVVGRVLGVYLSLKNVVRNTRN